MDNPIPKITIQVITYNRAKYLDRMISSVLNQSFQDFELNLFNNGSQDKTREALKPYEGHPNIRIFHLEKNLGYKGGCNIALGQIRGEWWTEICDKDELHPNAFEKLLAIPKEVDLSINAVTCNCIDSSTNDFSGKGLDQDQYLTIETIVKHTKGEFWGLTKRELIGDRRYNENLSGHESTLWYPIDEKANRYYIHEALRTYHTNIPGRLTTQYAKSNKADQIKLYETLLQEKEYWRILKTYDPKQFQRKCLRAIYYCNLGQKQEALKSYEQMFKNSNPSISFQWILQLLTSLHLEFPQEMIQWVKKITN